MTQGAPLVMHIPEPATGLHALITPDVEAAAAAAGVHHDPRELAGSRGVSQDSGAEHGSAGKSAERGRRHRGTWIAPALPNTHEDCPCTHNSWDNVRVKKNKATLRCRVCQLQWKVLHDDLWRNQRCADFGTSGQCRQGAACGLVHIHKFKQNLQKRQQIWGDHLLLPRWESPGEQDTVQTGSTGETLAGSGEAPACSGSPGPSAAPSLAAPPAPEAASPTVSAQLSVATPGDMPSLCASTPHTDQQTPHTDQQTPGGGMMTPTQSWSLHFTAGCGAAAPPQEHGPHPAAAGVEQLLGQHSVSPALPEAAVAAAGAAQHGQGGHLLPQSRRHPQQQQQQPPKQQMLAPHGGPVQQRPGDSQGAQVPQPRSDVDWLMLGHRQQPAAAQDGSPPQTAPGPLQQRQQKSLSAAPATFSAPATTVSLAGAAAVGGPAAAAAAAGPAAAAAGPAAAGAAPAAATPSTSTPGTTNESPHVDRRESIWSTSSSKSTLFSGGSGFEPTASQNLRTPTARSVGLGGSTTSSGRRGLMLQLDTRRRSSANSSTTMPGLLATPTSSQERGESTVGCHGQLPGSPVGAGRMISKISICRDNSGSDLLVRSDTVPQLSQLALGTHEAGESVDTSLAPATQELPRVPQLQQQQQGAVYSQQLHQQAMAQAAGRALPLPTAQSAPPQDQLQGVPLRAVVVPQQPIVLLPSTDPTAAVQGAVVPQAVPVQSNAAYLLGLLGPTAQVV